MPSPPRLNTRIAHAAAQLLLLAIVYATFPLARGASEILQTHEEIESIAAARRLYLNDEGKNIPQLPLNLDATIYYVDSGWNLIYVGDPTGSILLKTDWRFAPHGLEKGENIRIHGHTAADAGMPSITAEKIIRASHGGSSPIAIGPLLDFEDYDRFRHDSSAVRIEITVKTIYQMHRHTFLDGVSDGHLVRTIMPRDFDRHDPSDLLGATLMVNGILGGKSVEGSRDPYFFIFANSDHALSYIEPAPVKLPAPKHIELAEIAHPSTSHEHLKQKYISVSGIAIAPTKNGTITIGDGESAVKIRLPEPWHNFRASDYLHVKGFVKTVDGHPSIAPKQVTRLGGDPVPPPKNIDLAQIREIANGMQIETSAFIIHPTKQGSGDPRKLILASTPEGPPLAHAIIDITKTQLESLRPQEILTADLTGSLDQYGSEKELPTLLIDSLDDITPTSRISPSQSFAWFKSFAWILASCAILTTALFLWVFTLRRQVAIRTVAIRKNARKLTETAEKLRVAKLAEAQVSARLRDIYRSVDDGILVVDPAGKPLEANPSFARIFELKNSPLALDASDLRDILAAKMEHPVLFSEYWQNALSGADERDTTEWELPSGPTTEVSAFTAPVFTPKEPGQHTHSVDTLDTSTTREILGRVWVFRDLTRQRQLEKSLVQAQKMEAVGRLAGGIAHDFNNLLTGVTGALGVARTQRDQPLSESEHLLETAESAARRAAELVQSLLGFSRQSRLQLKPGNCSDVIRRLQALVRHSFDARIEIHTTIDPTLWIANLDSTHLEQVLLNMCVNSKDAMPEGGTITIEARNNPTAHRTPADPGENCIELIIKDTGTGIAPKHLATIFEPFFTTKEQGKGTGLGLAMSYGIIEQHGGWITCHSSPTTGTSFHIYLPRYTGKLNGLDVKPKSNTTLLPPPTHRRTLRQHAPSPTKSGRRKHILVVDDEAVVRAVAEGLFRNSGFKVSSAENGRLALNFLASLHAPGTSTSGHVDLIILDLTMPVLSGKDTLRELRHLHPEIPVIIASGYLVDPAAFTKEAGASPDAFMQKPYELDEILEVVTTILGRSEPDLALSS